MTPPSRGTLVSFHAHPDDEAIATGGTLALAAAAGHRVVIVFATRGEVGEVADGFLDPGEVLAERRSRESETAAAILGAARVAFLGYRDSGMADEDTNEHPDSFHRADVDEAAGRLATILEEEQAEVLTVYDPQGGYRHPDHIQVHRVGVRAAALAKTPRVYEATADREHLLTALATAREEYGDDPPDDLPTPEEFVDYFTPAAEITTRVDVRPVLAVKRAALVAHASQIDEGSAFASMSDTMFAETFGTEWFIRRDVEIGAPETWLFDD